MDLDENREVTRQQAEVVAARYGLPYFECSAKSGDGIDECFSELIELSYQSKYASSTGGSGPAAGNFRSGPGGPDTRVSLSAKTVQ